MMWFLLSDTMFRPAMLMSVATSVIAAMLFALLSYDGSKNVVALNPLAGQSNSESAGFPGTSATETPTPIPESTCDDVRARHPGLPPPLSESLGTVRPSEGQGILGANAYVLLELHGVESPVAVTAMWLDGKDILEKLYVLDPADRFVYWDRLLDLGCHVVEVEIQDGTGKSFEFASVFYVRDRRPFTVPLYKGWNLISFPSWLVDESIESVFAADEVTMVVSFDSENSSVPWRVAIRNEYGVWSKFGDYELIEWIEFTDGYWVFSTEYATLSVHLGVSSSYGRLWLTSIATSSVYLLATPPYRHAHFIDFGITYGWNLVSVVDITDYDQTEDNFGEVLRDRTLEKVTAGEYLYDYSLAYTWDAESKRLVPLEKDDFMRIGYGVWVYYEETDKPTQ